MRRLALILTLAGCSGASIDDLPAEDALAAMRGEGGTPVPVEDLARPDFTWPADLAAPPAPDLRPCGECAPGATRAVGACQVRRCSAACAWGAPELVPGAECAYRTGPDGFCDQLKEECACGSGGGGYRLCERDCRWTVGCLRLIGCHMASGC